MYDKRNNIPRANAFLSALLGIMTFIFMCIFIPLLVLRPMNVGSIVRNTDVAGVLEETGMAYEIVDAINELPFIPAEVEVGDVERFIQSPAVSNEIGKVADDYAKALARGDLDHHLTSSDVIDIVKNLEPEVQDVFDHHMTESDYRELEKALDNTVNFSELSAGNILDEIDVEVPVPVLFISVYLVWGVGILCAATVLLIFVHHRRWIADGFRAAGIPIMLSGLLFFLIGLLLGAFPQMIDRLLYAMSAFIAGPAFLIMMYGLAFTALGVLFLAIGLILNRRAR